MRHHIFCFSGYSGVGKDECAGHLVRTRQAIHTGLADPAKRHMADLYGFTKEQLFGPSHFRNAGDPRYPKNVIRNLGFQYFDGQVELRDVVGELRDGKRYIIVETRNLPGTEPVPGKPGWPAVPRQPLQLGKARYFIENDHPNFFLSPREALQLYCNLMNDLYLDSWIRKGIEVHQQLAEIHQQDGKEVFMRHSYDRMMGVIVNDVREGTNWKTSDGNFFTCFSDFRHRHEISLVRAFKAEYTPVVIRVKHPKITMPPYDHRSETEQASIPDSAFDFVIDNDGSLQELYTKVEKIVETVIASDGWRLRGRSLYEEAS